MCQLILTISITQVSRSKKGESKPVLNEDGNPMLNAKGKKILKSSYSVLQDDFFNFMRAAGYTDVERGERGSTEEHLTVTQFKVQAEQHRLETVTGQVEQAEQSLADAKAATEKQKKKLEALQKETKAAKTIALTVQDIEEMGKKNALTGNVSLTPDQCDTLKRYAVNGITGIQIKQSADFASSQLQLPPDYEFMIYEDKGLSGYYSDRPDFQKMLHDIEAGKIRAVVCYKLDRISRKTSDLLRLVDFLDKYDVALLVCSNNINTMISTSKIMISFLAIIAEFERDIIAERISDNLVELAKDGRLMGGCAPTGFSTYRVTMGTGKNKTSITYLQTEEDEKTMVLAIFKSIRKLRSLSGALKFISQTYKTKNGKDHTILSLKDIARNPNYCTADQDAYEYFYERNGNICKDQSEFDGTYGLAVYNRTEQEKLEDEDSTFIEPKFAQVHTDKPIDEWIVSIGKHEGFIPGKEWVEVQEILDAIEDKYNRPHRATNALLSGLLYCPICGHRLNVFPESNRWTNGQPRFKYGCPNQRYKKSCTFKPIDGNRMDSFVLEKMATVADEASGYYTQILDTKMESLIRSDSNERDLASAKTKMEKIQADIAAQVRNMREADENIRSFIQADISQLSEELSKTRDLIVRLEDAKSSESKSAKGLGEIKKIIFSFPAFIESSAYEEKLSLLNTVIERIIILDHGNEQICHIFVKGTPKDKYDDFFVGGYLSPEFLTDTRKPQMCNRDRDSKRHSLGGRAAAARRMQPPDAGAGISRAHGAGKNHRRL